jgi:uncharacterized protein Yka (UPF0111/DUF47 family)
MKNDLRSTFATIHHSITGRFEHLQRLLESTDDKLAAEEFRRLIRAYEDEVDHVKRQARNHGSFARW